MSSNQAVNSLYNSIILDAHFCEKYISELQPALTADIALVKDYAHSTLLGNMFFGFEATVINSIYRLSQYDADLIICVPLKSGTSLETTFNNLASIELAGLRAGVIFAIDRPPIYEIAWLEKLKAETQKISTRFEFVEIVHTTARPIDSCRISYDAVIYVRVGHAINEMLHNAGFTGANVFMINYSVVREEIRLILKGLDCRYVAWFDADQVQPIDVIPRLLRSIEGETRADFASGWAYERHYPILKPTFDSLVQFEPSDDKETKFYKDVKATYEQMNEIIRKCYHRVMRADILFFNIVSHPVSPSALKRLIETVEILFTGFGCVLMKKQVNDNSSFITLEPNSANSEDSVFCQTARKHGHKLVVDPLIFCEHIDETPSILSKLQVSG